MTDDLNSLEDLPTFQDALKLSKDEYYRYANGVYDHRKSCQAVLAQMIEKFHNWCEAFNCLKSEADCKIYPYPGFELTTPNLLISSTTEVTLSTSSYNMLMKLVGYNGTCFDDYYCIQRSSAICLHYILGIACLTMCLPGILLTSVLVPIFNIASNRTPMTLYLTVMAIVDCIYMILFTIIIVIQYIPPEFTSQLNIYFRFNAFLIPHGLPSMQLMELLSVWLMVAIVVDRFLYLKFGFNSKIISSRAMTAKIIAIITIILVIYTIPKYLEYKIVAIPEFNMTRVIYSPFGFNASFKNLLLHWLKVPIEMFLPYLATSIFCVINSIKFHDVMCKRKRSRAMKMNSANENYYNKLMDTSITKYSTPNLNDAEDKENAMVAVSLILGFSLIALKIPKFVLHALKSEEYVELSSTKFFQPINDFLDLTWVLCKPIVYLCTAKHFLMGFSMIFRCRKYQNEMNTATVKVYSPVTLIEMQNHPQRVNKELDNNITTVKEEDEEERERSELLDKDERKEISFGVKINTEDTENQ